MQLIIIYTLQTTVAEMTVLWIGVALPIGYNRDIIVRVLSAPCKHCRLSYMETGWRHETGVYLLTPNQHNGKFSRFHRFCDKICETWRIIIFYET